MRLIYLFDDKVKPIMMLGKRYCNPAETGIFDYGISCIRENDVNVWFYTKNGATIAFDAGHLNFAGVENCFQQIGLDPHSIKSLFLTHADVDHCGGVDIHGKNIFPNATVYLGEKEEQYLTKSMYRMKKLGVKINNCVEIAPDYIKLSDMDRIMVDGIEIMAIHVPGHTLGHMCYIVDGKVLISGDCLAVNNNGGYSFFDFFTQFPEMNKQSLKRLKSIVEESNIECVCTGHSGYRTDITHLFEHIDESAVFGYRRPFDSDAPWDIKKINHKT